MSSTVAVRPIGLVPQTESRIESCPIDIGNKTHTDAIEVEGLPMPEDDIRELIAKEIRYALRDQVGTGNNTRSVDTLRRDIGIFAILLGMMVQTGAAFYWAGGVSRTQEANKETMSQIQAEQSYTRAQLQLIDGQLKLIQGKQEADKRK